VAVCLLLLLQIPAPEPKLDGTLMERLWLDGSRPDGASRADKESSDEESSAGGKGGVDLEADDGPFPRIHSMQKAAQKRQAEGAWIHLTMQAPHAPLQVTPRATQ
jgi:hypothetical protein